MLVAYCLHSTHVETAWNYLSAIKKFSDFEVEYYHVTCDASIDIDLSDYDVVFQDCSARLCFENYVAPDFQGKMQAFHGLKVLAVQDEYDNTNTLREAIRNIGFDVVLTCVPQDSMDYVFPRRDFPGTIFWTVRTGYVPEWYAEKPLHVQALSERPIVVGYRGRDIGARYGRLGFEKYEIGRRMKEICDARGIRNDIAMDEESRIYGTAWFDFIGKCRAMLGSETASNVFDFDGTIANTYKQMTKANGGRAPTYEEFRPFVEKRDNEISMGQVSARIFECALLRTPMILFRGRYSNALDPEEHYIPLEKDFSNVDVVLEKLNDFAALESMAERAYRHLISSGRFNYSRFVGKLDAVILRELVARRPRLLKIRRTVESLRGSALDDAPLLGLEDKRALLNQIAPRAFDVRKFARKLGCVIKQFLRGFHPAPPITDTHAFLINLPTSTPMRLEVVQIRHEYHFGQMTARENDRIDTVYREHLRACETHLEGLAADYRNERLHLGTNLPEVARQLPIVPEAFLGARALAAQVAAYMEFRSSNLVRRTRLKKAFYEALESHDAEKALAASRKYSQQEREDEKLGNAHFMEMNATYTNCRIKAQAAIDEVQAKAQAAREALEKTIINVPHG
ncbi:MAG: hypothetical protein JO188_06365 [Hyphomicrobiales bacterium]|nr:hypothetical protein [Hyphomicrobiales bacterium]